MTDDQRHTFDLYLGHEHGVPIIAQNVRHAGASRQEALAALVERYRVLGQPEPREATDEEYAAYVDYWHAKHDEEVDQP